MAPGAGALLECEQSSRRLLLVSGDTFGADSLHPMRLADPPQAVEALNRARIAALHITSLDLADNVTGIIPPLGFTVRAFPGADFVRVRIVHGIAHE